MKSNRWRRSFIAVGVLLGLSGCGGLAEDYATSENVELKGKSTCTVLPAQPVVGADYVVQVVGQRSLAPITLTLTDVSGVRPQPLTTDSDGTASHTFSSSQAGPAHAVVTAEHRGRLYASASCTFEVMSVPGCGDGSCAAGETCASCAQDCGVCPPVSSPGDAGTPGTATSDAGSTGGMDAGAPTPTEPSGVYGSSFNSDTLANLNIGGQWLYSPSYRFRAEHSSTLTAIRIHLLGPGHGTGYGGGTGGTIRATVQTDDSGIPSGTILATLDFVWGGSNFPRFTFSSPATLTAGTTYHLVFTNEDPNPSTNYMSINSMFVFGPVLVPRQPNRSDSDDFTALMKQGSNPWKVWGGYTPNIDLTYGSGAHQGQGVIDIDTANGSLISGTNNLVRERITVSGGNRVVSGAAVRIAKTSGSGNLVLRLEDGSGTLIDSSSVSTSTVPVINRSVDGPAGVWVSGSFSTPRTLIDGATYHLRLSTDASTSLWTRGIQQGDGYGFDPVTYFADGFLQVTTNGGSSWSTVPGLGTSGDLQFYLY